MQANNSIAVLMQFGAYIVSGRRAARYGHCEADQMYDNDQVAH